MPAILTFLIVIGISLFLVRVGTIALIMTGLSEDIASFQALSAYTGSGYTTQETEKLVNHPGRRRILRDLMIVGNMGFVSTIASAIFSMDYLGGDNQLTGLGILFGGFSILLILAMSPRVQHLISRPIAASLAYLTDLEIKDYAALLQVEGGFSVAELFVEPGSWLAGHSLIELRLNDEGVWLLGIRRQDGNYLGVPRPETKIRAGDTLVVYGQRSRLKELPERPQGAEGDSRHQEASIALRTALELHSDEKIDPDTGVGTSP
jgi:hypothetical protein